ncbi:MAG: ferritin-like domain-containing protein [Trichormus sp.]
MNCQRHRRQHQMANSGLCGVAIANATTSPTAAYNSSTELNTQTQQAMIDAINDEYHARAFYTAVINKFGEVRPFSNIVHSEDRHVSLWNHLFSKYRLPIPADNFMGNVQTPDTLKAACQAGVESEIANVEMYDRFLEFVQESDLRAAFTQLRYVSQNHHLPAFQRCVSRY